MAGAVHVEGLREFQRALAKADRQVAKQVRDVYRKVGEPVRADAAGRLARYSARSAAGFRTRVRQTGVTVEQTRRRTTGRRGDWGALQMEKALIPSLEANEDRVVAEFEKAMDEVADIVERG